MHRHLLGGALLIWTMSASAADILPWAPSTAEMKLLPEYCKVRSTDNHKLPEFQSWMQRVGPKFLDLHHYCAGLNFINRYKYLVGDKNRNYYLSRAVPEIDYVAKDMAPNFPLASEVYLNRGIALQLMGKNTSAYSDFILALERDPRQVRAYLEVANFHLQAGNQPKALEIIAAGLSKVPGNKRLQKEFLALGGKEPFPMPEPSPPTGKEADIETLVGPDRTSVVEHTEKTDQGTSIIPSEDPADSEEKTSEPKIGSPTNPYCRFCP